MRAVLKVGAIHLDDGFDMEHVGGQAFDLLLVRLDLTAEIGVKPDQRR